MRTLSLEIRTDTVSTAAISTVHADGKPHDGRGAESDRFSDECV